MDAGYPANVLPEARLQAFASELERMAGLLNVLRTTQDDDRGVFPWQEGFTAVFCRQLWAALDLYGNELGEDFDADEARKEVQAAIRTMRLLDAQCDQLARLLELSTNARDALGSDVMQAAFAIQDELVRAGRGDAVRIPQAGTRKRR